MKPIFALAAAIVLGAGRLWAGDTTRPNILIILADDLGRADVGFAGGKQIKTPNLDKLAGNGAKLEQYYVQPVCSPTRGALLTGRYPMRFGLQVGVIRPWEQRGLPLEEQLLPQRLQQAGYVTAIVGKWHLGQHARAFLPTQRGFDHQYGHYSGALDYNTHERDGGFDWHRNDRECRDEGYSTHLIAKEAVRLIETFPSEKPFFLYVPFNAVHAPHQVPAAYKEPYAHLPEPRRTYAGMVAAMDEAVGQIYAALEKRGTSTNTLILFSSDNGGPNPGRVTDNGPLRAGKGTVYEGGTRVCAFVSWPGHIQPGSTVATPLHAVDWYPTLTTLARATSPQKLPLDGLDILPVITAGKTLPERDILLNTTPAGGALRRGDWKLVTGGTAAAEDESERPVTPKGKKAAKKQPEAPELYNLAQDPGEKRNLAKENPGKLQDMMQRYQALARVAAQPGNQPKPPGFKAPRVWGEPDPPPAAGKN